MTSDESERETLWFLAFRGDALHFGWDRAAGSLKRTSRLWIPHNRSQPGREPAAVTYSDSWQIFGKMVFGRYSPKEEK